jgi:hypothetical protein
MFQFTVLDRPEAASRLAEDSLARLGTLGIVVAGLAAILVFML